MSTKGISTKYRQAHLIRTTVVVLTIILFVFFIYTFVSSYRHYKNIHQRIDLLQRSINETQQDYSRILSLYNEAENEFRMFSVDFDGLHYENYKTILGTIETKIDSMLALHSLSEEITNQYPKHIAMHKMLTEDFLALRIKIGELLGLSEELNEISQKVKKGGDEASSPVLNHYQKKYSANTDSVKKENILVIEKKPFLRRLFNSKPDTIRLDEITHLEHEREEIIREFSHELDHSYSTNQNRLEKLRESFSELRSKERELLMNNANLLHEVNKIIYTIRNNHINSKRFATGLEIRNLSEKTKDFKWLTIQALTFMFVMICLLIYYQFFAMYYERKLLDEKSYASKLAQEKTDTLAEITHEIRTPINSLIGIVDILRKKEVFDPQDKLLLESAYSDLGNTSKTISDILNISRIEGQAVHLTKFPIRTLVEDIIESYRNQAQLKGLVLHHEFAKNLPAEIYSDEFKLRQIITNLISNAVKYSEKGAIICAVQIKKNKNLHIQVSDEGIGMSKEVKDNIFKKYYTANHRKDHSSGIGLGLYITQKLVENLGGKIWYESQLGKGSTFYTDIPLAHSDKTSPINQQGSPVANNVLVENIHLLIVDDNQLSLLYLKQLLSDYRQVSTAKNGKEAMEIIHAKPVDVIITDINMPVMGGNELLEKIRTDSNLDHIKVIANSSDNEQVHITEDNDKPKFDYVLFKPFDQKEVIRAINTVLA